MMSNYDVLAMITAADALEKTDVERSEKLLEEALKLNDWLIGKEPKDEMRPLHIINKMQIMKRQRELTADERQMLEDMLNDEFAGDMVKAGVYLLLDRQEEFQQLFETMREDEKKSLKEFPIWRFVRESEGCDMNLGECWLVRHDEVMAFMEREHCKTLKAYLPSVKNK